MGRLNINTQDYNITLSGTTISGSTKRNIITIIDESGNAIQMEKKNTQDKRYKYYIDPENTKISSCYIGISNTDSGDCTYGIALGFGDRTILLAKY